MEVDIRCNVWLIIDRARRGGGPYGGKDPQKERFYQWLLKKVVFPFFFYFPRRGRGRAGSALFGGGEVLFGGRGVALQFIQGVEQGDIFFQFFSLGVIPQVVLHDIDGVVGPLQGDLVSVVEVLAVGETLAVDLQLSVGVVGNAYLENVTSSRWRPLG